MFRVTNVLVDAGTFDQYSSAGRDHTMALLDYFPSTLPRVFWIGF